MTNINKQQSSDWQKDVTPELENNLLHASQGCLNNADTLINDSNLLLDYERYARAAALAVLAIEECGKALHLVFCITSKAWNSQLYRAVAQHNTKQAYADGILHMLKTLIAHSTEIAMMTSQNLTLSDWYSSLEPYKNSAIKVAQATHKKPKLDKLKQDAFYVSITKEARLLSEPSSISEEQAKNVLLQAREIFHYAKMYVTSYDNPTNRKLYADVSDIQKNIVCK